jgi:hypothetical protein
MSAGEPLSSAGTITSALVNGSAAERESAYRAIEKAVREEATHGDSSGPTHAHGLCTACARPLIDSVLCAPATRVRVEEARRVSLLLFEMSRQYAAVSAEMHRKNEEGKLHIHTIWTTPGTVFAEILAKEPCDWNRDDAISIAAAHAPHVATWTIGVTAITAEAGVDEVEDWMGGLAALCPFMGNNAQPFDRFTPLALLCVGLVQSEVDTQPEGVIAGAGVALAWMTVGTPPVAATVWRAGFLDVVMNLLERYNPVERICKRNTVVCGHTAALQNTVNVSLQSGVLARDDMVQSLIDAGAVDCAISSIQAYQLIGPGETSVCTVQWGAVWMLDILLGSPHADTVCHKLRSAGVDALRYLLDHPLEAMAAVGAETGNQATRIAALVWGKDEDAGGLTFKQLDIDKVVEVAGHRGNAAMLWPMSEAHGRAIRNLCVSDVNKKLLLQAKGLVPLLVDSLLLDPEHPRRHGVTVLGVKTEFEEVKGAVQRDFAEAIAQLAMYPPAHEVLLRDSTVTEALARVAQGGWEADARMHAEFALAALSGRPPLDGVADEQERYDHIMLSYQWDVQPVVTRIVRALRARGYSTWFDIDDLSGSTVDGTTSVT